MNVQLCTHKTIRYHCTVWTHIEIHASVDTIVCIWERNTQKVTEWVHNGIVCVYAIHKWMKSIPGKQCAILFNICRRLNSHKCRIINEWRENIFDVRPWNCVMAVYFPCRRMHTHTHVLHSKQHTRARVHFVGISPVLKSGYTTLPSIHRCFFRFIPFCFILLSIKPTEK